MKHKNRLYIWALCITAFFQFGFIKTQVVKTDDVSMSEKWFTTSPADLVKKVSKIKDPLSRAVVFEIIGDFDNCAKAARSVSPQNIIFDRALMLELRCAKKSADDEKGTATTLLTTITHVEKNEKLLRSKDKMSLIQARISAVNALVRKSQWKVLKIELDKIFDVERDLSKQDRATVYNYAAELMVAERKWTEAYTYFTRAKEIDPETGVDSKIKNVLTLMPQAIREKIEKTTDKQTAVDALKIAAGPEEQELFDEAQRAYSKGDGIAAMESLVKLLRKFPISVKSKWAQDKINELITKEIEKSRGPDGSSVAKNRMVKIMMDLDADRLNGWGRVFFDQQSYLDAGQFFERASELLEGSPKVVKSYYMAGRSFQLAQESARAKEFYKKIIKSYSMSPEFIDATIQWGLINFNEKEYSEAITHLEMTRSRNMSFQQDMVSLFWLFQSYKMKNEIALKSKAALDLVERFPLTYYGLIAYQDINQKLPTYDKADPKDLKLSLSQAEWKILLRAKVLFKVGMLDEASEELGFFSERPLNTDESVYISKYFAQGLNYQKVFNLLGTVFDNNIELRTDKTMRELFPREFWAQVSDDKKRAGLDPLLLLSVMRQESAFRAKAVSRSGAVGLLQMIPPTAEEVKKELGEKIEVPKDLFDPNVNVKFCAYYLAKLIKKYDGSIPVALAAYNAGPTRISLFIKNQGGTLKDTWVDELPLTETTFYVKSILKNYIVYRMIYAGQTALGTPPWTAP